MSVNVFKYSSHTALGKKQEIVAVICYWLKIFVNHHYKFNTSCQSQSLYVLKAKKDLGALLLKSYRISNNHGCLQFCFTKSVGIALLLCHYHICGIVPPKC